MFRSIEFYNTPDGEICYKAEGQPAKVLKESDRDIITYVLGIARDRYPESFNALMSVYSESERNRNYFEFRAAHRFIRCNFGEYNQLEYDIDGMGNLKFEEVKCPLRGECRHEGIICKPILNTSITDREMQVFRLIALNFRTEQIAEELHIAPPTVNRHRENIKAKISAKSVAEMITYWHHNNLK